MRWLLLFIFTTIIVPGCTNEKPRNESNERGKPPEESLDQRAGNRTLDESIPPLSPDSIPVFNGSQAFQFLLKQTSFGPRNPNSEGHSRCLNYLATELRSTADDLQIQNFSYTGYAGEQLALTNLVASFSPLNPSRILLCAHWDTRPRAEHDQDKTRRNQPILGANDGASGVAVLLEIASLLHSQRPEIGVDIVLFDGEDYGLEGDTRNYLLGSRHFASTRRSNLVPRFGILLDMIGDKFLEIPKEGFSVKYAPDIVNLVWNTARDLGYSQFIDDVGQEVIDDHLPLNEAGIKTIDLIDFDYPDQTNRFWHTHQDIPANCSMESLEAVGTVLVHLLYTQRS